MKKLTVSAMLLFSCALMSMAQEAVTATPFKLYGEKDVNNVKVKWALNKNADEYRVFRDGKQIGVAKGDTYDDYGLAVGKTYAYYVESYKDGSKVATAAAQSATTFTPSTDVTIYDNYDGKEVQKHSKVNPAGFKIGNLYFQYRMERNKGKDGKGGNNDWQLTESFSKDGLTDWSTPRVVATYPGKWKFEGNSFRFNQKTGKAVFISHLEDADGYTAAKIFLAQITPKGKVEVGTQERPLGHDSRDQSLFVDDDGTGYLLSATNMNSDINIYQLDPTWTKVVKLVNTICERKHRETPAIIKKDGEYYFFSSKASGWYPSQAMYCSSKTLDGKWTELREIGNNSTFGAQFNRINTVGKNSIGVWSYRWGAQFKHKDPTGNFPRISVAAFNKGFASMDYYRYIEMDDDYGLIPVQMGKYVSLNKPVKAAVKNGNGYSADCITDGCSMASAPAYKKGSTTRVGTPYMLTVDLGKATPLKEILFSTNMVNGSEAAYKFVMEASANGTQFKRIVDGTSNVLPGFLVLTPSDTTTAYQYVRIRVYGMTNLNTGASANWADGILELAVFGK